MNEAQRALEQYLLKRHIRLAVPGGARALFDSLPSAQRALRDPDVTVRFCAIQACDVMWNQGTEVWYIEFCIDLLVSDPAFAIQNAAANQLYKYHDVEASQRACHPLAMLAKNSAAPTALRADAYNALRRIRYGDDPALDSIRVAQSVCAVYGQPINLDYVDWAFVDRVLDGSPEQAG